MKKIYAFIVAFVMSLTLANAQYYYLPYPNAGTNPGGLNMDNEYPFGGTGAPTGWTTISSAPTNTTPVWSANRTIPFPFQFDGSTVTQFKVSSSAILTFDINTTLAAPPYAKSTLPSSLIPDKSVCLWGLASLGTNDIILTKTFGTAPNRQLWIQFNSYGYGTTASSGTNYTYWSIVLEETTNNIYLVDCRTGGYATTKLISAGIQMNATTAFMVAGSPNLASLAGADASPIDNSYYQFIYGVQASDQAKLRKASADLYVLVPGISTVSGEIQNLGANTINNVDIKYEFNGTVYTSTLSNINLTSGNVYAFTHNTPINVTAANPYPTKIWVDLANDADRTDDTLNTMITGLSYLPEKRVLIEEGTGTWCGWCPRGAVYTEEIDTVYPGTAIVVAVHNADPMANAAYDAGLGTLIGGYPGGCVDRKSNDIDPTDFEATYLDRINDVSPADIGVTATYNIATRQVDINVSTTFAANLTGDFRLNAVLVEDDVTGTAAGYNQANYYSSTSQNVALVGAGHNWQAEPNPVPAASMSYDFVGRDILGGFDGQPGSLPASVSASTTYNYTFNYTLPTAWNESKIRVIGMLQDVSSGHVLNSVRSAYLATTGINTLSADNFSMTLFPNPADVFTQLEVSLAKSTNYTIEMTDVLGKVVYGQNFNGSTGKNIISLPVSGLNSGIYLVKVNVEGSVLTTRLMVK
jgi:hypothetical protein